MRHEPVVAAVGDEVNDKPTTHELVLPLFAQPVGERRRYPTIVADPPWQYGMSGGQSWNKGRPSGETRPMLSYPQMSIEEITMLPVGAWAQERAHLYLWTTQRYLRLAYNIVEAWGFEPRKVLMWCKAPAGIAMGGAYGNTTEFIVLGVRGALPFANRIPRDWFDWKRGAHSEKPSAFYDMVEHMSPGPYLDVFSRKQRFNWDTWGNEAFDFQEHGHWHDLATK